MIMKAASRWSHPRIKYKSQAQILRLAQQIALKIFQMRNAGFGTQIHCPTIDMFSHTSEY